MNETWLCYDVQVTGRVQGVGFRFATQREARKLELSGWVRNCADGSVEARICGHAEAVQKMLDWLAEGPPLAHVAQLTFALKRSCGEHDFHILEDKETR